MDYWEECENYVRKITGGRRTPGSGNKNIKGDIILPGFTFEVKSTIHQEINIEFNWLVKLEKEYPKTQPILVVFFGNGDYQVWMLEGLIPSDSPPLDDWVTKKITPNNLPEILYGPKFYWTLQDRDILKELE